MHFFIEYGTEISAISQIVVRAGQQLVSSIASCQGDHVATAFGTLVRRLREGRGLSLREVSQLSGLDHAYVHRLETGAKEAPSEDALNRLLRALKPNKRQEHVLRFLVGRDAPLDLVDPSIIDNAEIALEDFESVAQMSFRGRRPDGVAEWRSAIEKVRKIREEIERGG